jgi:hypothetical protein
MQFKINRLAPLDHATGMLALARISHQMGESSLDL